MSLTLYTGLLLDLDDEEDVLEERRSMLDGINSGLRERGLPEHMESEEGDSWSISLSYGAVDDFKAAVLNLWKQGRLAVDGATVSHLLGHSLVDGLWIPLDFEKPFVPELSEPSEDDEEEDEHEGADVVLSSEMGPEELEGFVAHLKSIGEEDMAREVLARAEAGENPLGPEPEFVVGSLPRLMATLEAVLKAADFDLDPASLETENDGMDYQVTDERFASWLRTPVGQSPETSFLVHVSLIYHEAAREALASGVSLVCG